MIRLDANPYNRVLLCTKPKNTTSKKKRPVGDKKQKAQSTSSYSDEVLEYYSGEEVKQIYKWQLCDTMTVTKDLVKNLFLAAGGRGDISLGGGGSDNELTNWDGTKKHNGWGR